jgi:bifunctional non-homologous end joining protein LigD
MLSIVEDKIEIKVRNPEKIMFPNSGINKSQMIEYYGNISEYILPYIINRPLVMHRYPDGIEDEDFYQKKEPDYFPDWIASVKIKLKQRGKSKQEMVVCNNKATLLYLANQACITPHVWLSKTDDLNRPDRMVFELDPPEGKFRLVKKAAQLLKDIFDEIKVNAYLMTTGSDGAHIVLPLDAKSSFEKSREFAKMICEYLESQHPRIFTTQSLKTKREGRLYLDYLRNSYGQTSVAPYSLRARRCAPVACPISWDELSGLKLNSRSFNYHNIFKRLKNSEDPWKNMPSTAMNVAEATEKFRSVIIT